MSLWRRRHLSSSLSKEPQGSVFLGQQNNKESPFLTIWTCFSSGFKLHQRPRKADTQPLPLPCQGPAAPGAHVLPPLLRWDAVCWCSHQGSNSLCPQMSSKKAWLSMNPQRYAKVWWAERQSAIQKEALTVTFAGVWAALLASVKFPNTEVEREPSVC